MPRKIATAFSGESWLSTPRAAAICRASTIALPPTQQVNDAALGVLRHVADRSGDLGAGREGGRRIDRQHRVRAFVGEHRGKRCGPVLRRDFGRQRKRVAQRRVGSQQLFQRFAGLLRQGRQLAARAQQCLGGNLAEAVAVGQDGEAFAAQRTAARHRFGGVEQVAQGVDAHPAGAAQGGLIDIVGAERPLCMERPVPIRSPRIATTGL
jgi:hypothetical protein